MGDFGHPHTVNSQFVQEKVVHYFNELVVLMGVMLTPVVAKENRVIEPPILAKYPV